MSRARLGRNNKAYSAERKDLHTAHYVSLMRPTKTQSTLKQPPPCNPHGYCLAGLHWNVLARVGRNSKAYSAERKELHTAHYVSLMRPTTTQSTLKQPNPATRMDTTLQGICFIDKRVVFKFKIRLKTPLYQNPLCQPRVTISTKCHHVVNDLGDNH